MEIISHELVKNTSLKRFILINNPIIKFLKYKNQRDISLYILRSFYKYNLKFIRNPKASEEIFLLSMEICKINC